MPVPCHYDLKRITCLKFLFNAYYYICREQYVIFVKLGFVTVGSVFPHTPVRVRFKMQYVLNVREKYGIMEDAYSDAAFAPIFYVKMISLSTKHPVKFWNQRIINVSPHPQFQYNLQQTLTVGISCLINFFSRCIKTSRNGRVRQ